MGITLLNRLVERYGRKLQRHHAFPEPSRLSSLNPAELMQLGYSRNKARFLIDLAQAIRDNRRQHASLEERQTTAKRLQTCSNFEGLGVGPRNTCCYAASAGLTSFQATGAPNNLERWLKLRIPLTYERARHVLKRWAPFGGLIYFHLLMDQQERLGYFGRPREQGGEELSGRDQPIF